MNDSTHKLVQNLLDREDFDAAKEVTSLAWDLDRSIEVLIETGDVVGASHCDHPYGQKKLPQHIRDLLSDIKTAIDEVTAEDLGKYPKVARLKSKIDRLVQWSDG